MVSLRAATLVTGDSLELADEVRRLAPNTPYVRFNFGPPESLLTMTRDPQDLIVSSRRLDPDTRIDVLLEGFRLAKSRSHDLANWRLVVAGHGRDEDRLRSMSMDWEDVRFVGQLDGQELVALLLTADVFVSIPRSDGTSAALLEAMASGAMPIVTDLPANREWVDEDVGVIIPNPPSAHDVARAIETAIARSPTPERVRARVRDTTWERRSPS